MFSLSRDEIISNIDKFKKHIKDSGIDAFFFDSSDEYLNEYVPLEENRRYYFSGFTGSTGPVWVTKDRALLFVDGRYHEQADQEVDSDYVEVIKIKMGERFNDIFKEQIEKHGIKTLGVEGSRISYGNLKKLEDLCTIKVVKSDDIKKVISFKGRVVDKEVYQVEAKESGATTNEKLATIIENSDEAIFISALDTIAWLTNGRGFHLPYQSTYLAKAIATKEKVFVFVSEGIKIEDRLLNDSSIEYVIIKDSFEKSIQDVASSLDVKTVYCDSATSTYADYKLLKNIFSEKLKKGPTVSLAQIHNVKNSSELEEMRQSFNKSDRAIFNTIKWLKNSFEKGKQVSELDFYNKTTECYKNEGAIDQSFNTISAFGENSSIIHFSDPSETRFAKDGEFALLDSGAFYNSGFATDTTRTCFLGKNPTNRDKEIYTMVLKGLINAEKAIFPPSTTGSSIDALARVTIASKGYEYGHGTGHGVGVNVHEGSFRISPAGTDRLVENQVGSIEPGIYIPGYGGVRLENIVVTKKHPDYENMLYFEPLVYIGYETSLINMELLNEDECSYLVWYQLKCKEKGRSF